MAKTKSQIAADGKARADAFMAKFADYSTTPTYRRRRKALDDSGQKECRAQQRGLRKRQEHGKASLYHDLRTMEKRTKVLSQNG